MSAMGVVICLAIALSAALGVYLRKRQTDNVAANREAVPVDFARDVPLDEHRRAADYTIARTRLAMGETLYEAAVSILWLAVWMAPLYALVSQFLAPGLTRSVVFVLAVAGFGHLLELPFSLTNAFWLEERFGFNRLTLKTFILDEAKEALLGAAIGTPLLYGMFWLLGALPDTWWLVAYVAFMSLTVAMTVIYPTFIAPLFNKFTPMEEGTLKARMEALLAKCGFESNGLYVMDASKRSAHGNAYFTGFGKAKRIVFFDTLLEKHSVDEIESILAHELGHFKFGHVRGMILQAAILAFVGFAVLYWAFGNETFAGWFGLPNDPGVVIVALLLAKEPLSHLLRPLLAWRSRKNEFEADDFARQIVGKEPMISALTRLTRDNLSTLTPDPLYATFYFSHPPVPVRVAQLRAAG
ncbi:M48 family metallopeptidase [Methylocystis sp. MJC1]|jgi:STE24 endopeptidase|uniref:M48 family metallopeptidase n=1 Tax=Methylocystis sp. MJC1 TaxID=2654282 RepID=UPI0013EAB164|nr:M48 family metallopeptidase [Methylocystis sp. MJC1]KAF2990071.1 Protease HtpX [Methylocystis sp. MJC1]MBU6527672.1 M48 family metallopeptidase [Methylocystis sp. MJC1]UZX10608.1 M48 family metallopeptidase [Methylocystis sp. MJC1]